MKKKTSLSPPSLPLSPRQSKKTPLPPKTSAQFLHPPTEHTPPPSSSLGEDLPKEMNLQSENEKLRSEVARLQELLKLSSLSTTVESAPNSPVQTPTTPPLTPRAGAVVEARRRSKMVMVHISLAFAAGMVFVFADSTWDTDRFAAGVLYSVGSLLLLFAVPALHATGIARHVGYKMYQPFSGGVRFVVLQALSWAFYSLAVVALIAAVMYGEKTVGLVSSGGVLGILSQVLMASSLQTFVTPGERDPENRFNVASLQDSAPENLGETPYERLSSDILHPALNRENSTYSDTSLDEDLLGKMEATGNKRESFAELITMNFFLIVIMVGLSGVSELFGHVLPAFLSLIITLVAVLLTHGMGGKVLGLKGWTFFQPFAGGTKFVILQGFTWMLFSVSVLCQLAFLYIVFYLGIKLTVGLMHVGGIAAICSEVLCVVSFRYFRSEAAKKAKILVKKRATTKEEELKLNRKFSGDSDLLSDSGKPSRPDIMDINAKVSIEDTPESWASLLSVLFIWNIWYVPITAHILLCTFPSTLPHDTALFLKEYTYGVVYTDVRWSVAAFDSLYIIGAVVIWAGNFSAMQTLGAPRMVTFVMSPPWVTVAALYYNQESEIFPMLAAVTAMWVAYAVTYIGDPDKGKRSRVSHKWLRETKIWERVCQYFAGRVLLSDALCDLLEKGEGPADPSYQCMLGYHPHGIIPCGMVWGMRCEEWRQKLPNFYATGLTASIMHYVPLMRDFLQWTGIREVSRKTLLATLEEGMSPVVVVGGQSEMFLSKSKDKGIKVVRYHHGFFRIAQQEQKPLIPIFAFGETKIYDNVDWPTMQRWTKDRLGFPIPFVLLGRWGLPVPRRKQVILSIGAPILPLKVEYSEENVIDLKLRYFQALQDLFDEFKGPAGYADHHIEWVDSK